MTRRAARVDTRSLGARAGSLRLLAALSLFAAAPAQTPQPPDPPRTLLALLAAAPLVTADTALCDIPDIDLDRAHAARTVHVLLGTARTWTAAIAADTLAAAPLLDAGALRALHLETVAWWSAAMLLGLLLLLAVPGRLLRDAVDLRFPRTAILVVIARAATRRSRAPPTRASRKAGALRAHVRYECASRRRRQGAPHGAPFEQRSPMTRFQRQRDARNWALCVACAAAVSLSGCAPVTRTPPPSPPEPVSVNALVFDTPALRAAAAKRRTPPDLARPEYARRDAALGVNRRSHRLR